MDALSTITAWFLSIIVMAAPPGRKVGYPEAQETREEAVARYTSIAEDVADVVYDPNVKPLFKGPDGRLRTATVILSIMAHESSYMKHVDYNLGKYSRGDSGKSWCMMQILVGNGRTKSWNKVYDRPAVPNDPADQVQEGYTGEEMIANRKLCIAEGLKILKGSFYACGSVPLEERLRSYASGSCTKGLEASRARMNTAMFFFGKSKGLLKGFTEGDVTTALLAVRNHRIPDFIVPSDEVL